MARLASAPATPARSRGVSLVETLVSLACMLLGALSLAHAQARLQLDAEQARLRTQALRVAQSVFEQARRFTTLAPEGPAQAYEDLRSTQLPPVQPPLAEQPLSVQQEVVEVPGLALKALRVRVSWRDRHGLVRSLELETLLAAAPPGQPAWLPAP